MNSLSTRVLPTVRALNLAAKSRRVCIPPRTTPLASLLLPSVFSLPRTGRSYTTSSSDVPEAEGAYTPPTPTPSAVLQASLGFVSTTGWTTESLARGAETLGFPSVAHGMFPNGAVDLIDYFLQQSRRKMVKEIQKGNRMEGLRTHEKIQLACTVRLNMMRPYIKQWPEALAIMASNVPMSLEHLGKLVDDMWFLAGDKSADMNWYTKRASLAAVYTSTELYMTHDTSPEFVETFKFLDRRLADVATVGKGVTEIGNLVSFGARSMVGIIASRGNNI